MNIIAEKSLDLVVTCLEELFVELAGNWKIAIYSLVWILIPIFADNSFMMLFSLYLIHYILIRNDWGNLIRGIDVGLSKVVGKCFPDVTYDTITEPCLGARCYIEDWNNKDHSIGSFFLSVSANIVVAIFYPAIYSVLFG